MTSKKKILFLIYHGTGHFNACFKLIRILQQRYDVILAGVEFFKGYVAQQSLNYYPLKTVPFGLGLEHWYNTVIKNSPTYWNSLKDRWSDRLYHLREEELRTLIDLHDPDFVFLDAQQSTDFIVLHPLLTGKNKKFVLVHAMLPQKDPLVSGWKFLKQKLIYLGLDDNAIIRRRQNKNQTPRHYFSKRKSNLGCVLQQLPEIVLAPRELDVDAPESLGHRMFLGFHPDDQRVESFTPEYPAFRARVDAGDFSGRKILFFSFGTIVSREKDVLTLIENLCRVATSMRYILIIVHPEKNKLASYASHPDIFIFDKVPQQDVLTYTDLLINHGGLNSIFEAVEAEVPLLVATVQSKMDWPKNAERVIRNKLGLRIPLNEPVASLASKIDQLLTDPSFRKGLQQLKSFNDQYSIESFVENMDNLESM